MAEARWYAVQTYSGHEGKVQRLLQRQIDQEAGEPDQKEIREVLVPAKDVTEIKNGKRVTVSRKLYPGYILVNMVMNQRTLHTVSGVQGVLKFLGAGSEPQPLRQDELSKILGLDEPEVQVEEQPEVVIPFSLRQVVEVVEGPFKDFTGTVQEIFPDKGKVRVEVSLFGRPTNLELDYTQLKGY